MKNIINFIINKHQIIIRYLVVLLTIVVISSLYPRNRFNYDFDLNKPWKYENLYSPFTFTIQKSTDSIVNEERRALSDFHPYYSFDESVLQQVITDFLPQYGVAFQAAKADSLSTLTAKDSIEYIEKIATPLLETIYEAGIVENAGQDKNNPANKQLIRLVRNNRAAVLEIGELYNVLTACTAIREYMKILPDSNAYFMTPILCESLLVNVTYDEEITNKLKTDLLNTISLTSGVVQQNQVIIAQGAIITPERYQVLMSLKNAYESGKLKDTQIYAVDKYLTDAGYFIITLLVLGIFILFMQIFEQKAFSSTRKLVFILVSIGLFLYLVAFAVSTKQLNVPSLSLYVLPFALVPIIVKTFFGSRMAIYTHIVIILLSGFIVPLGFEFLFLHFLAGMVAIIANVRTQYWSHFFISTAYIFIAYSIGFLGVSFLQESTLANVKWATYGWLAVNAFLTLLAYPLIPIFEKLFGFVSDITLVELGDLNRPLLKRLSTRAPGTFWHSLQVANLAEAAATEINANALLCKVGALYHDIGKMHRAAYFIENQKTDVNPHDDLPYEESARIIIEHTILGIEMAKKYGLPTIIIDFIRTHHGKTRTEYFYQKYVKEHPKEEVDDKTFRYPGPLPYSKETAIVMMADSVEAASKSLKNPNEEDINRLVDNIIEGKIKQNQFVNCDLSFKDITIIKKVLKKRLRSFYHIRISYPEVVREK